MTDPAQQSPVVVGVDGSPSAQDALTWAAIEASSMRRPLHIVHCVLEPVPLAAVGSAGQRPRPQRMSGPPSSRTSGRSADRDIWVGQRILDEAEVFAQSAGTDLVVTSELSLTTPAQALLDKSQRAGLVAVGSRGLGGFTGLVLGSVATALASHAACPVVVVRPRTTELSLSAEAPRVVIGVDGSDLSTAAIGFAFRAAARREAGVTAIHAWTAPATAHPARLEPVSNVKAHAQRLLTDSLQAARPHFLDLDIQPKLVRARASKALVTASAGADLVVVGSRGYSGVGGLVRGSVSQSVLQHALCTVAVVR